VADRVISRENSKPQVPSLLSPREVTLHQKTGSASVFDLKIHQPPRIDHKGYNKETHKGRELLKRNTKNILNEKVSVPEWWTDKHFYASQTAKAEPNDQSKYQPTPITGMPKNHAR